MRALVLMIMMVSSAALAEPLKISPEEALALASEDEVALVDVRLPVEWAETGLPEAAIGISLQDQTLKPRPGFIDDMLALVDGDRDQPIALICARGNRSAYAQKTARGQRLYADLRRHRGHGGRCQWSGMAHPETTHGTLRHLLGGMATSSGSRPQSGSDGRPPGLRETSWDISEMVVPSVMWLHYRIHRGSTHEQGLCESLDNLETSSKQRCRP